MGTKLLGALYKLACNFLSCIPETWENMEHIQRWEKGILVFFYLCFLRRHRLTRRKISNI